MNFNLLKKGILNITLACLSSTGFANTDGLGGISLGSTRVIYPIDAKQVSLPIINSNNKERFLINAWVEDHRDNKTKDFLITPPLFVAEAKTENTLRIINVATSEFAQDRESVFWINVKAIPSIDKSTLADKNILQLAVLSRIKLFVRPTNLKTKPEASLETLKFSKTAENIMVNNPSPYHVSFVNLYLDGVKQPNVMASPFTETKISNASGRNLSYQTVNDYGGLTPKVDLELK
ncbi:MULTISPECIES: fimbria/pilus periplasmic chaperone [Acinetobacter]|uniref:Fimbria/pilus periplasmic chaperone n=1 Tax=Acinetobacter bereziniae TaxID=106648 RepID=A0A0A8TRW7_ACIBZ|nr:MULTISPECIES: fimbria/pilus periplasmic chaperone [Acinetobacter]ELW78398.1 gram-negative pili assembly chaperone, N-terminal domain protein [Acinetobacter sp. WC-743]MBI0394533.1 fimbria/pilus periplasmic chaperone [Acinetobacter bereziniae]MBJ8423735.1 fimbria/pilus periplasmic chaperone [Acinetobacter bereziniae]MBJ8425242.1 fimbria/pilus periplasmic chaperone [Acinetobacter bereziniae]MBJ8475763.1 fimbria/pilus periplasmic chaperone [Acinetobacter bereziniae]